MLVLEEVDLSKKASLSSSFSALVAAATNESSMDHNSLSIRSYQGGEKGQNRTPHHKNRNHGGCGGSGSGSGGSQKGNKDSGSSGRSGGQQQGPPSGVQFRDSTLGLGSMGGIGLFVWLFPHVHIHPLLGPGPNMLLGNNGSNSKKFWAKGHRLIRWTLLLQQILRQQCTHLGLLIRTRIGIWTQVLHLI